MHLYTVIQLFVIGLLWALKLSPASMVYPLVIVFLIPLKWLLGKFVFTKQEMEAVSVLKPLSLSLSLSFSNCCPLIGNFYSPLQLDGEGESDELEEGEFGEYVETTAPY